MITEQTVFIIGAGGSKPFGFPTGQDLRESICIQYINKFVKLINNKLGSAELERRNIEIAKKFAEAFYNSNTKSIDLFLSRNQDFSTSGKRAISLEILEAERGFKKTGLSYLKNDWYGYLFNRMSETLIRKDDYKLFQNNRVTFITFNYDRSFENFLENSLSNSFLLNPEAILQKVKSIPIYHIYGQIGFLPWQTSKPTIYFGQGFDLELIDSIQSNIKIIYDFEKHVEDEILNKIKEAERIFFLGFGYAEENLKLLNIPKGLVKGQKVFGTALGFYEEEIIRTKLKLNGNWVNNFVDDMILENCDCLTLLRKYL